MTAIAAGDELALTELYKRYGAVAYGLAFRIARDSGIAEEAVQDAFLSVWRSASRFDAERGSLRTWLLTVVHRRAVDLVKRAVLRREEPIERPPANATASTAEEAELRSKRRRVRSALDALPAKHRQTVELSYYGGLSQSQIASLLGVPLGTIKSRMFNGLAHLRTFLFERDIAHEREDAGRRPA